MTAELFPPKHSLTDASPNDCWATVQKTLAAWQVTSEIVILARQTSLAGIVQQALIFSAALAVLLVTGGLIWYFRPTRDGLAMLLLTLSWAVVFAISTLILATIKFVRRLSERIIIDWSTRQFTVVRQYFWGERRWQYPFSQVRVDVGPTFPAPATAIPMPQPVADQAADDQSASDNCWKCYQLRISFRSTPLIIYTSPAINIADWAAQHHDLCTPLLPAAQALADQFGVVVRLPGPQR